MQLAKRNSESHMYMATLVTRGRGRRGRGAFHP